VQLAARELLAVADGEARDADVDAELERLAHEFLVADHCQPPIGTAKRYAKDGAALALMDTGVLNADEYYVQAPHLDSLDSRYRLTGWIAANRIIGRAYALF